MLSTLKGFNDEYEAHIYDRLSPTGPCKNLKTYIIYVGKWTGCLL